MQCTKWIQAAAITVLMMSPIVMAQETEKVTETVSAENCQGVDLQLDFSAGVIDLFPADIPDLAKIDIFYTPRSVRYTVEKTMRGNRCVVDLGSERRRNWSDDESENEWKVQLSRKTPMSMDMNIGACEARMDLGGIPLTDLRMDIGAAEMELDFSEPNPALLKQLSVDCGASSLTITRLAMANARSMSFDIGAGSCDIDLRGQIKGEVEIEISVGVGSMNVILPQGIALMVEGDDDWLSSLDFHGLDLNETHRGTWETDNFERATDRIIITADVSMGSISIYAKR
jgi:hypothetical protein